MRDLDRVRDKIEVRLEPRQVVMLAVGTMIFSGLLFAAGFMLGRSRAPAPVTPPLALGAVASEAVEASATAGGPVRAAAIGEVTFQFPTMLGSRPGREVSHRQPMRLSADVLPAAEPAPKPAAAPAPAPPPVAARQPIAERAPEPVVAPEPAAAPPPRPATRPAKAEPAPAARQVPAPVDPIDDEDNPDAAPPPPAGPSPAQPADAADARYTLQVKAARDKAEADAFIAELRAAGFAPHTVLADIPGKGRFYRIRVGRFASMADARAFQRQFKRKSGLPDGGFVTDL